MLLSCRLLLVLALFPSAALAQRETTRDSLDRLQETLALRLDEGSGLVIKDLVPAIVVSVTPAFEETKAWYPTAALAVLVKVFGAPGLRSCEACRAPRLYSEEGRLEYSTGNLGTAEITRLDDMVRGKASPARTAIWLDETADGVSIRIIDLKNSRIVMAENFDPQLTEPAKARDTLRLVKELDRRAKGNSITHAFVDVTFLGNGPHISFDWAEQWGDTNANLSGVSFSLFEPLVGVGASYYRVLPFALNIMVGAKVLLSVPTALLRAFGNNGDLLDKLVTGVLVVRLPFGGSNFGLCLTVTTNGKVALGLSLLNISLLPFLP